MSFPKVISVYLSTAYKVYGVNKSYTRQLIRDLNKFYKGIDDSFLKRIGAYTIQSNNYDFA